MANLTEGISNLVCNEKSDFVLQKKAHFLGLNIGEEKFAEALDQEDKLKHFREKFSYPIMRNLPCVDHALVNPEEECVYLSGNSLGLMPKSAEDHMQRQLQAWAQWGVLSHFTGELPAAMCDEPGREFTATLVGANKSEVVLMNGLTVNLNLLLIKFYRPVTGKHKILIEAQAFPSDRYAITSQIAFHGYNPETSLIILRPRNGEHTLRTEDILKCIEIKGDSIAVVLFSGVHYYTGQKFDMESITKAGHEKRCIVGFDLAHAIGNVNLDLHRWNVDFACWCSYKYLNSGAGGMAGIFVHDTHHKLKSPQLLGWWSNKESTRFEMRHAIDIDKSPENFRISNPPPFLACLNLASLEIFMQTSMKDLLAKQFLLTGYLEMLLKFHWPDHEFNSTNQDQGNLSNTSTSPKFEIITPSDPSQRGNQLSLMFNFNVHDVEKQLHQRGILCDSRLPNVIRVAPAPLYNSFRDVYKFVQALRDIMDHRLNTE